MRGNGRVTLEEAAAQLGIAKATASRRPDAPIEQGAIFVRTILDPANILSSVESLPIVHTDAAARRRPEPFIAEQPGPLVPANTVGPIQVQSITGNLAEMHALMRRIGDVPGLHAVEPSLFALHPQAHHRRLPRRQVVATDETEHNNDKGPHVPQAWKVRPLWHAAVEFRR